MSENEKEVNWHLTFRAALIISAIGLVLFGVFGMDRIECKVCWRDVTRHYFSVFGYFSAFGFAIGWTLPESAFNSEVGKHSWNTRQGFTEGSLGVGALITVFLAAMHFLN